MIDSLDYAVLAGHGSGINVLHGLMNMQADTSCLYNAESDKIDKYICGGLEKEKASLLIQCLLRKTAAWKKF